MMPPNLTMKRTAGRPRVEHAFRERRHRAHLHTLANRQNFGYAFGNRLFPYRSRGGGHSQD